MPRNTATVNSPLGQSSVEDRKSPKLCACGCGQPLVNTSRYDYGLGRPRRFIHTHKARKKWIRKTCEGCGKEFEVVPHQAKTRKYCSRECWRKYAPHPITRGFKHSPHIIMTCPVCETKYEARKRAVETGRNKTCSKECGKILRDKNLERRSMRSPQTQKKWLLKERPHRCEKCGYDDIPEILTVHHKDENRLNGSPENLELICPNCHTKIHFLSGTGQFKRHNRRERKVIPENLLSRNEFESQ